MQSLEAKLDASHERKKLDPMPGKKQNTGRAPLRRALQDKGIKPTPPNAFLFETILSGSTGL